MRKATKTIISFAVILIAGLNFIVPAFAQDPFTSIAIGGIGGASGAGLFGSMAGMSGINIGWSQAGADPLDAMWNVLNPDHVYFSGEKHEATGIDEDVWDYITVDIGDWLSAQSDFIIEFAQENQVLDNDSGTVSVSASWNGIPYDHSIVNYVLAEVPAPGPNETITAYGYEITFNYHVYQGRYTPEFVVKNLKTGNTLTRTAAATELASDLPISFRFIHVNGTSYQGSLRYNGWGLTGEIPDGAVYYNAPTNVNWTSDIVDTSVFDDWGSAKVKIPHTISQLTPGWTVPEFMDELDRIWTGAGEDNIIIEDGDNPGPVPPQPIPDTPLGDVPFDDWVDLWGQSIWDQLTRLEEKQELMVINQETGLDSLDDLQGLGEDLIEDVDDLIGLETDINENLEDVITYEQGISEDVEDIGEYVEDIDDEVIVIVDEMGNVIDVLEGIDAKIYAQGQSIGSISTEVGTVADTAEAIQTEVEAQSETLEDVKDAVEDMVPYVAPLPDIATDTETMVDILPDIATATQTSTQTLTDTLPDIATATETATQTLTDTLPDIKDATQTLTDTLPDVITEIQDATTTLTDTIPNIDDICLNIDEAPYKDIETGVDRLPRFMLPFITDLRSALGIWHYVTEWLAQISTTFAFISGCLVGTSIMTPIYAAIAGFMCIKIYRRMTS